MNLTIDGRAITVEGRPTLLEAARASGIFVPSLCDHPGLDPYAACRLCLVEVKGRKGLVPACSTAAEEGMEVVVSSPDLQALRKGILELILAEHPHACLICDEKPSCDDLKSTIRKTGEVTGCVLCPANGRCELQRVVDAMGLALVPYPSRRRPGEVRRDDPFIDRDNSLCILCGRCVRVCQEVRGASVLTFVSRGSETVIGTALDRRLLESGCRFCGACVDVCPTGSLTERASRYDGPAEAESKSVCTLCGQGCALIVKTRAGRMAGSSPDPDGPVNRGQACVKGRFLARTVLDHPRRILRPLVRESGSLHEASWEEALALAASRLGAFPPRGVSFAGSAQSSCEDLFVLLDLAKAIGAPTAAGPWSRSAAAGLKELGRSAGRALPLNFRMSDIDAAGTIVVVGEDLAATQPIVGLHVHRAAVRGASVIAVGTTKRLAKLPALLSPSKPPVVLVGPDLFKAKDGLARLAEVWSAAAAAGGRLIALDREANVRGGLAVAEALTARPAQRSARALYIAGPHPALKPGQADFVVVQACYEDETTALADVVLPETTSFESEGTFVNVEGRIQVSAAAVSPRGEARPGWLILADLAERLGAPGFGYGSAAEVRAALAARVPAFRAMASAASGGEAFLAEEPAAAGTVVDLAGPEGGARRRARVAPRDPDDYKGLSLALESKGLKLVRGR